MQDYTVTLASGRAVQARPCVDGEGVQLAILSVHGNPLAWVSLDATELPGVLGALKQAQGAAERDLMGALGQRERKARKSYQAALARNPWLQPGREKRGLR